MSGSPGATSGTRPRPASSQAVRRRRTLLGLVILVIVLVVLAWGATQVMSRWFEGPADYPGPGSGDVVVQVEQGDTAGAIGATLSEADVVASTQAFVDAASADERSLGIQPGTYSMAAQMSAQGALDRLLDPNARVQTDVAIPEGLRLSQTVNRLVEASGLPQADFEQALRHPGALGLPRYANGSAEGFLFPATYSFEPDESAQAMLQTIIQRYDEAATELDLVARSKAVGITPLQAITVASLVQAEVAERDFGKPGE